MSGIYRIPQFRRLVLHYQDRWRQIVSDLATPILLATFFVLSFYRANMSHHPIDVLWNPFAVVLGYTLAITMVLLFVIRRSAQASFVASGMVLLNFVHGYLFELMPSLSVKLHVDMWTLNGVLFRVWLLLLIILFGVSWFFRKGRRRVMQFLACVVFCMALVAVIDVAVYQWRYGGRNVESSDAQQHLIAMLSDSISNYHGSLPHIFYIVPDGYARDDVLANMYGYPTNTLTASLVNRGFVVVTNARSNYAQTALSQGATLNMQYLDDFGLHDVSGDSRAPAVSLIRNNTVAWVLNALGYRLVTTKTGYEATDQMHFAQNESAPGQFYRAVMRRCWFVKLSDRMLQSTSTEHAGNKQKELVMTSLSKLHEYARHQSPMFVYCHVVSPHPPFVFDREGGDVSLPNGYYGLEEGSHFMKACNVGPNEYRQLYLGQLEYINKLVVDSIDKIMQESTRPVVIVVQSDHGPGSQLDWDSAEKSNMHERMAVLSAFYLPPEYRDSFDPPVSSVNTFRNLFRTLFEMNLESLPDKVYFSTWDQPYRFYKVNNLDWDLVQ